MLNIGGTYREVCAEETFARIQPLLEPIFGITRIADITGLDDLGIHTVIAIRPNGKVLANSQGKGLSKMLATVSALMESIEIWHGENLLAADLVGSYQTLRHCYPLVPLESLQLNLYSPLLAEQSLGWVPATDLVSQAINYLPHTFFNQDRATLGSAFSLLWPTSNGLASGNSLPEALCHALFELIERDCISKKNSLSLTERALDLSHLPSAQCSELVKRIQKQGYELRIYDIRSALNIPCYYVLIDDFRHIRNIGLFGGYGCHFADDIALMRALTEASQSRLTYISGARDDISLSFYQQKRQQINSFSPGHYRPHYQLQVPQTFADCLQQLIDRLYVHGYKQIYFHNLTRQELGIAVVHCLIPGLCFNPAQYLFKFDALL